MAYIQIQNLTFSYHGQAENALHDINLTIERGAYVVLCGQSGSGKSTLLRHLKSVLAPHGQCSGSILFQGIPLEEISLREQALKIGYVMQNPQEQLVTDKVWHELAFGLESTGCDPVTMRSRVAEMACYFGIQDWFHKDVATLSGGQKQLLNLASIMAMRPEVLILDEPTSQLDPLAASDFLNTVRKINIELGTTVIITEHRLEDIFPAADLAVVMDRGKIAVCDTPRAIGQTLWQQKHPMAAAMPTPMRVFYEANAQGACPLTVREGRSWLTRCFPTPPAIPALPDEPQPTDRPSALSIGDVWFRYEKDSPDILRGLSAQIPQGSLYAIVGGNGAGKSTALKAICGICKPYRGKITLFGKPMSQYKGTQYKNCLAMLPQEPQSLFVKDTLLADLQEVAPTEALLTEISETCQITHLLSRHPHDLSGGEQQRAALAKVLLTQPRLLLLDEPTKGIDSFFKETLAVILCKLKENGMTIVMVSHDVEFCARYADLVSMFFDGQLLTTDTTRRFFSANSFYTTAANRMSRCVFQNAVTAEDTLLLYRQNREG